MKAHNYYNLLLLALSMLIPLCSLQAQSVSDCDGAQVICTNSTITFSPNGIGNVDDFSDPSNFSGCLASEENNSVWYYFEFDNNTLPGEIITFVIDANNSADYDFAVFGPGADCGALGGPIRCSYAGGNGDTGLDTGATENSEGAGGDGFVAPISVGPGQGFYLLIDNFSGNGQSFTLTWGGDAADNLNCNPCSIEIVGYTPSWQVCPGDPGVTFDIVLDGTSASTLYQWTSPDGGMPYLSSAFVQNPTVTIPPGVNGTFTYNLTITDGACTEQLTVTVTADGVPPLTISGDNEFCPGETVTLTVTPSNLSSYSWSNGDSGPSITVGTGGTYTVTATNASNCTGTASFTVTELPAPTVDITGDLEICSGASTTLTASAGFIDYSWNTGAATPSITISTPGLYSVTATSATGCDAINSVQVTEAPSPMPVIDGPSTLCPGESGVLSIINGPYQSYLWSDGSSGSQLNISGAGVYSVTVTNAQGCFGNASYTVTPANPPVPQITGDLTVCPGAPGILEVVGAYQSYSWSTGETTPLITIPGPGPYSVTVTNTAGCTGANTVNVTESIVLPPVITGPFELCENVGGTLETTSDHSTYSWSTGANQPFTSIPGPGTYSLTVTNADGCSSSSDYTVGVASPLVPIIVGNTPFCQGESITLGLNETYASYSWSTGSAAETTEVFNDGPVTVTVTAADGCTGTATVDVISTPLPVVDITGPGQVCTGNTASLNATPGYASYVWGDGTVGGIYPTATPGFYSVTVTDANGCTGTANYTLDAAPQPTPSIDGDLTFCEGSATTLTVLGDYAGASWSNGQMGPAIVITASGTYTATVTNADGCTGTAEALVTALPPPTVDIDAPSGICWGTTEILHATPGYPTYQWSDFSSTQSFTQVSTGGSYSVTATDANGCQGTASVVLDVFDPPLVTIDGPDVICSGNAQALVAAGGPFETYLWSTGATTDFISVDAAADYSLTVTDFNGCSAEANTAVAEGDEPIPVLEGALLLCNGGSTLLSTTEDYAAYEWSNGGTQDTAEYFTAGAITLTVTNEAGCTGSVEDTLAITVLDPPLVSGPAQACPDEPLALTVAGAYDTYQWSSGGDSSSTTVSGPGTYTLLVSDSLGCEGMATYTVAEAPVPSLSDQDTAFCTGDTLLLVGPGGYASYVWADSLTQADLTVTTGGIYSLTVANTAGCQDTAQYRVAENSLPSFTLSGENTICDGEQATLMATAGFEQYAWSTGAGIPSISVDSSGTYALTVTDENGCQHAEAAQVAVSELPNPTISGVLRFCEGGSTVLHGQDGLSYEWSTGSTAQELPVDQPGTYTLTVENAAGCVSTDSVTVQEVDELLPQIEGPRAFCAGVPIQLVGEAGYASYEWSTGATTDTITVDTPGAYTLSVTDANGCTGNTQLQIAENVLPDVSIGAAPGFCAGEETTLEATPGYASYAWSSADTAATISVAEAGTYNLTVTDVNGCQNEGSTTVAVYPVPEPQIQGALQFCPEHTSTLSLSESYSSYVWSTGSNSSAVTVSNAGTVAVSVTDTNGCSAADTVTTLVWPSPEPEIIGELYFCDGGATVLESATEFAAYTWSTGGSMPAETVDEAGTVSLTVADSNGCVASDSITVDYFTVTAPQIDGPAEFCTGEQVGLQASGGYTSYQWSNGENGDIITVDTGGLYRVSVIDTNGCQSQASFQLFENRLPDVTISGSSSFCPGGFTNLNAGGDYAAYLWSDNSTEPSIQVGEAGIYSLTVTDEQGCVNSTSITVSEQSELTPVIAGQLSFCPGSSTTLSAGGGFSIYEWSSGNSEQSLTVDAPGTYSLTVEDASGCSGTTEVDVQEYPMPSVNIDGPAGFCSGDLVTLTAEGANMGNYEWSDGSFEATLQIAEAGDYTVVATDINGCVDSASTTVEAYPLPSIEVSGQDYYCAGSSTTLSAPSGFEAYNWNNGEETAVITAAQAGTYAVAVTDANGCIGEAAVALQEIALPLADAGQATLITCLDTSVVLGGPGTSLGDSFAYDWEGPAIVAGQSLAPNTETTVPGIYTLIVTDTIHGCASLPDEVVVTSDTSLPNVVLYVNDTLDCVTSTVELDGSDSDSGLGIQYAWYNGSLELITANTTTLEVQDSGTYFLELVNENSGCRQMDGVEVAENTALPGAEAGAPQRLDCAQTSLTLEGTTVTALDGLQLEWADRTGQVISTGTSVTVSAPGTFYFKVLNPANGCTSKDSVAVTEDVDHPLADAGGAQSIDCLNPEATLDGSASTQGSRYDVQWAHENTANIVSEGSYTHTATAPGLYFIVITNTDNHCVSTAAVEVLESNAAPSALLYEADGPTCFGDTDGSISINGVEGGTAPYLYSLDGVPFSAQTQFGNLPAGTYPLVVQDMIGCEYRVEIVLEEGNDLWVDAGPDLEAKLGETLQLSAEISIPETALANLVWEGFDSLSCYGCPTPKLTPTATSLYSVTVIDENGCVASDDVRVFLSTKRSIYMPSAFSPNGDDSNDRLFIQGGVEVAKVRSFELYSRWGEAVFFVSNAPPNDPAYGWDGSFNGQRMNSDLFAWQAEIEFVDGEVVRFKGEVLLMR